MSTETSTSGVDQTVLPRQEPVALAIGDVLGGRYEIIKPLGEGGMGRVYEATDQQLQRRVAIKVAREGMTDATSLARFTREARAAAALAHPNTCRLYEVGEHGGQPFLVMELLDGESLAERLRREPIAPRDAIAILRPLLNAVAALHGAGLIHRDLKPSNVLLTADGVKLLDFGLARNTRRDAALTTPTLTAPGAVTGTLRYMAPEQVTGDPVDERTDIFALGVMLFEMLTGHVPFDAKTNVEWLSAVVTKDPPPLDRADLEALDPVVQRCLQRRSTDRFASVTELAAALDAVSGEVDAAPPPAAPAAAVRSIVVLPFRVLQSQATVEFLQQSVPEGLTALLSGWPGWRVMSNREASRFDAATEVRAIGRELGVDQVLTGTVLAGEREVRVTAQLIRTSDGSVVWTHTSQHALTDSLALQDAVCGDIASALSAVE